MDKIELIQAIGGEVCIGCSAISETSDDYCIPGGCDRVIKAVGLLDDFLLEHQTTGPRS